MNMRMRVLAKQDLRRMLSGGRAELFLGCAIITSSLALHMASVENIFTELAALTTLPLLRIRPPLAVIPLCSISLLWTIDIPDHLLFTAFVVYLAIQYAVACSRFLVAGVLTVEWLLLAYVISAEELFMPAEIPAIFVELFLIFFSVLVGLYRRKVSFERETSRKLREHVEQELRSTVARYLHDNIARSLTIITMNAEKTSLKTEDTEATQSLGSIASMGRSAISDLQQLVEHLIQENPSDTSKILGVWHTESVSETVKETEKLLIEAGYRVEVAGIVDGIRLTRESETAFALAFSEITANIVKHAQISAKVFISMVETHETVVVEALNGVGSAVPSIENKRTRTKVGLESVSRRLQGIGGTADFSSTGGIWRATLTLPYAQD